MPHGTNLDSSNSPPAILIESVSVPSIVYLQTMLFTFLMIGTILAAAEVPDYVIIAKGG